MTSPLVDTNTLLAIDTIFNKKNVDSWAFELLSEFVNIFVYSDSFRFTVPVTDSSSIDFSQGIEIIKYIIKYDEKFALPIVLEVPEPLQIQDDIAYFAKYSAGLTQGLLYNLVEIFKEMHSAQQVYTRYEFYKGVAEILESPDIKTRTHLVD